MTRLLTIGTFDIPHMGHATFLRRCERLADEVIVGVNTDEFVGAYKGRRPDFSYDERSALIGGMGYTVLPNDGPGRELIRSVAPNILAIGSDWARLEYYAQIKMGPDELDELDCALIYIPYTQGISTSIIKSRR